MKKWVNNGAVFGILGLLLAPAAAAQLRVAVSIAPLHGLTDAVLDGVSTAELLIAANQSPHDFLLRPSTVKQLRRADLVVWVGPMFEFALNKPMAQLTDRQRVLQLTQQPQITLLPNRALSFDRTVDEHDEHDEPDDGHDDEHDTEPRQAVHAHGEIDPHLWLDPDNAIAMAGLLAATLGELDPANAARYRQNAAALGQRIRTHHARLTAQLAAIAGQSYLVYHDAYQYFERAFGLRGGQAVTLNPEREVGAARRKSLYRHIRTYRVRCVFVEPQYGDRAIRWLQDAHPMTAGQLNPIGHGDWFATMTALADSLTGCLAAP